MSEPTYTTYAIDLGGDLEIPVRLITGREAFVAVLTHRFKSFLGEWFLDQRTGLPWRQAVFIKNPNLQVIRGIFRQVVEKTPGCLRVVRFDMSVDFSSRVLNAGPFEAIITGGEIFRSQPDEFIITFP